VSSELEALRSLPPGRFEVRRKLGAGGFGSVWLVHDAVLGADVVLKVLHASLAIHALARARFSAEADILRRLAHPHIVQILDDSTDHDPPYLVMEFVDGQTLSELMGQLSGGRSTLPTGQLARLLRALADGLAAAHDAGVVHRDFKPANIMVGEDAGDVRILDFGVAKLLDVDFYAATTLGRRVGTQAYWAPEQVLGLPVVPATDQFALASITFELLSQRRAWVADAGSEPAAYASPVDVDDRGRRRALERILGGERPDLRRYRPSLDPRIDEALRRAWSPRPDDRFPSVRAWADRVVSALESSPDDEPAPARPPTARPVLRLPVLPGAEEILPTGMARPATDSDPTPRLDGALGAPDSQVAAEHAGHGAMTAATYVEREAPELTNTSPMRWRPIEPPRPRPRPRWVWSFLLGLLLSFGAVTAALSR
jgi:serine/threonine protein kinase